jgi:hypothetical protein
MISINLEPIIGSPPIPTQVDWPSFTSDNWAYHDESPINGGSLGGRLRPFDPDSSTNIAI